MVREAGGRLLLHHADERELPASRRCRPAREEGIIKGMYLLAGKAARQGAARAAAGQRHDPARSRSRPASCWRTTGASPPTSGAARASTSCARDGMDAERWNLLHPDRASRACRTSTQCLAAHAGPGRSRRPTTCSVFADQIRAFVPRAALQGAGHRRLRPQRLARASCASFFEVNRHYVAVAALKALADDGALPAREGRRGDQEVRHRCRTSRRPGRSDRTTRGADDQERRRASWPRSKSRSPTSATSRTSRSSRCWSSRATR